MEDCLGISPRSICDLLSAATWEVYSKVCKEWCSLLDGVGEVSLDFGLSFLVLYFVCHNLVQSNLLLEGSQLLIQVGGCFGFYKDIYGLTDVERLPQPSAIL